MPAPLTHIESTPELPAETQVVVIGGGIVGVSVAYYLALRGIPVALVEKGRIGAEQSSRNWGWCRQQNRDARELPIATRSLALWDEMQARIEGGVGFRRCGLLYLSDDDAQLATWARWRDFAVPLGVDTRTLTGEEASARGQATGKRWKGGVLSPTDGVADPSRAAPAIARAVMAAGGGVHQFCAARGLEFSGGRVSGVVTEKGVIRAQAVVMAGGAWASSFLRQIGVVFPQSSVRSSILSVAAGAEGLPDALHTTEVSATRRGDGGHALAISGGARVDPTPQMLRFARQFAPILASRWRSLAPGGLEGWRAGHETLSRWRLDAVTPMERMRILDPTPDPRQIAETHARAIRLLPGLAGRPIQARWAGYIDSTPDGVPAIGAVPGAPGLIVAAGFSGHGFGIGPGAGHLVADLIAGDRPIVDPEPYRPERLDGSAWGKVAEF